MTSHRLHRTRVAPLLALFMVLFVAGQAVAVNWSAPTNIDTPNVGDFGSGLVAVDTSTLVASYVRGGQVYSRRSPDNGGIWQGEHRLSPDGSYWRSDISSYGQVVDVAIGTSEVRYARSVDGGVTFSPSTALSPVGVGTTTPRIAHGPGGLVAVAWTRINKPRLLVRVSHDDGANWDASLILMPGVSTDNLAVAIGDGVIYVAVGTGDGILIRRSTDGIAWDDWMNIGPFDGLSIGNGLTMTATGDEAFVGYAHLSSGKWAPSYRATSDGGDTWSGRIQIAKPTTAATSPILLRRDGSLRALYSRETCSISGCLLKAYHRNRSDENGWKQPELVSPEPQYWAWPFGLVFTDRVVLAYQYYPSEMGGAYLQVRRAKVN